MSSDTSSNKEKSKKDTESEKDKPDDSKNALAVPKKRKPPMLRLNSKPVLAKVISTNNMNVMAFKARLEEGLKK